MRVLGLLGLKFAPWWLLALVLLLDVGLISGGPHAAGWLAPPTSRAAILWGPAGAVVEDEQGIRIVRPTKELWIEVREGRVRKLGDVCLTQDGWKSVGLVMRCGWVTPVQLRASGASLPPEEVLRQGFAEVIKEWAVIGRRTDAAWWVDYAERLARGDQQKLELSARGCAHDALVVWVLCVLVARGWGAWTVLVAKGSMTAGRGVIAVEDALVRMAREVARSTSGRA